MLRAALSGAGLLVASPWLSACRLFRPGLAVDDGLGSPDANGLRLPPEATGRIVARSGEPPVAGSSFRWPGSPDGGACFPLPDGGWIYVANSELPGARGGASALRFNAAGELTDAYPILQGTSLNCAGGPTPWGTWLSCEEFPKGRVWECDPTGRTEPVPRPALGLFTHEAVAVDPERGHLYLTEDAPQGRFYRFTPAGGIGTPAGLASGTLEVAVVGSGNPAPVRWIAVPDPSAARQRTALQVPDSTEYGGGEGICWGNGLVYFTTKYDNVVHAYDPRAETMSVVYDDDGVAAPVLTGVDNVVVAPSGEVLVAEDGGDMQIVAIAPTGELRPLVQIVGHRASEVVGPAFDPSGTRLYFSSQRGPGGGAEEGITFEVCLRP